MTTGTNYPAALAPRPALTCDEVATALPCPLCGALRGVECEHPVSRWRAALRWEPDAPWTSPGAPLTP